MSELQWISWEQVGKSDGDQASVDYRPVKWPPPAQVLAYWCTGYAGNFDEMRATVVALVKAKTPGAAKQIVERTWNPGVGDWRFAGQYKEKGPPGDRFPMPEWSYELGRWPWSRRRK